MEEVTQKYNIAWFRLSEFVLAGKKQQALRIFRLLAHSLQDDALVSQLEGDLLLSFSDYKAIDSYFKASEIYERNGKLTQAAATLEHILTLQPDVADYCHKMFKLYLQINNDTKATEAAIKLANALDRLNKFDDLLLLCNDEKLDMTYKIIFFEFAVVYALRQDIEFASANEYITQILEFKLKAEQDLQLFLSKLRALNQESFDYAISYLNK